MAKPKSLAKRTSQASAYLDKIKYLGHSFADETERFEFYKEVQVRALTMLIDMRGSIDMHKQWERLQTLPKAGSLNFIGIHSVAQGMGKTQKEVKQMVADGTFPARYPGFKSYVWEMDDVMAWWQEHPTSSA